MKLFERKIKLIGIVKKDKPKDIITIVCNEAEALEYIRTVVAIKHFKHYKQWCDVRGLDFKKDEYVDDYYKVMNLYQEEKTYALVKLTYNKARIAAELRNAFDYMPLGCSYELPEEMLAYLEAHPKKDEEKK